MLFKNQYHYFIAGLPDFNFESTKLPFTVEEFKEMLYDELKPSDKKLIDTYFLKYDNDNLLALLKNKDSALNPLGRFQSEDILETIDAIKNELPVDKKRIPPLYETFIKKWLDEDAQNQGKHWEDLLAHLYMEYGLEVKNSLISQWFELNLNLGNILTAIYAKKYKMDVPSLVVGDNAIAKRIRDNANLRDFGLSSEVDYFETLQRISEEKDIYERERKIDKFRWEWLDEKITFHYFDIEYIFAYLCKLQILERWVALNAEEGERVFRELIHQLKKEVDIPKDDAINRGK